MKHRVYYPNNFVCQKDSTVYLGDINLIYLSAIFSVNHLLQHNPRTN